jgi:alkylhydroperoxidase/carboxymuconolactone decarboxylase family protein YurZ
MDEKTRELIGVAASIAGHCRPCFLYHFKQAKVSNIPMKDLEGTIEFAKSISEAGNKGMYEWVQRQMKK